MFKYFKLTRKTRTHVEEPADIHTWVTHGVSEFFGTVMLALMLAGLSTIVTGSGHPIEFYLLHPVIVGFYAGFITVGAVLIIFLRWSCDLNPMVTITRIIKGQNGIKYGVYKITIQFLAALVAGLIIYAVGQAADFHDKNGLVTNHAIDAIKANKQSFIASKLKINENSVAAGGSWIFVIELVMGSILLFPIFSPNIKDKYRDLLICFVISMAVWMGVLSGTAAINPARGFAQQVPGIIFGTGGNVSTESLVVATVTMLLGNILAPFFYVFVQGLTSKYLNPWFTNLIKIKNHRSANMRIDTQGYKENPN